MEREARNATADQRRELRQAKSLPILKDIESYLQAEKSKVLPMSSMGVAIDYTLSNWEALLRYTEDGDLEIVSALSKNDPGAFLRSGPQGEHILELSL